MGWVEEECPSGTPGDEENFASEKVGTLQECTLTPSFVDQRNKKYRIPGGAELGGGGGGGGDSREGIYEYKQLDSRCHIAETKAIILLQGLI